MGKSIWDDANLHDPNWILVEGKLNNVGDLAEGVGVRDTRLHRRVFPKTIQDYPKRPQKFSTEDEAIMFADG